MNWPVFTPGEIPRLPLLSPPARLAVFGDPVAHSRSPQMHNPALCDRGLGMQYVRVHARPHEFAAAVQACREAGFIGVNCTIPHKLAAMELADDLDPLARRLGAVNTLSFHHGRITGFNTDGPGMQRAIEEEFALPLAGQRVLVLGAGGGAGRAAAIQCALAGCARLILVNRTRDKAEALARELNSTTLPGRVAVETEPELESIDLVINATSVGMKPGDPCLIDPASLEPRHRVYDMIYSPAETPLLAAARAAGARAANGLSMLLHQGAAAFEYWFGPPVPLESMRRGLHQSFSEPQ